MNNYSFYYHKIKKVYKKVKFLLTFIIKCVILIIMKGDNGVKNLEEKILKSFKKYMGKEVEALDLIVCWSPDCWPEDIDNIYTCEVMEKKDNGKVWTCECTKSGRVKEVTQL